jgi:hypothetical protein
MLSEITRNLSIDFERILAIAPMPNLQAPHIHVPVMFLRFSDASATLDCGKEGQHGSAGFHRRL